MLCACRLQACRAPHSSTPLPHAYPVFNLALCTPHMCCEAMRASLCDGGRPTIAEAQKLWTPGRVPRDAPPTLISGHALFDNHPASARSLADVDWERWPAGAVSRGAKNRVGQYIVGLTQSLTLLGTQWVNTPWVNIAHTHTHTEAAAFVVGVKKIKKVYGWCRIPSASGRWCETGRTP